MRTMEYRQHREGIKCSFIPWRVGLPRNVRSKPLTSCVPKHSVGLKRTCCPRIPVIRLRRLPSAVRPEVNLWTELSE